MKENKYPDWFLWAYQKGFVFWLSIAAVFGFSLLAVVLHLDDSVRDTEQRIHQDLIEVGNKLQTEEDRQSRELAEMREELEDIRRELKEIREAK